MTHADSLQPASEATAYVDWFRNAAPYIRSHRDEIFVIHLGTWTAEGTTRRGIVQDIALLATVGIRLVIVVSTGQGHDGDDAPSPRPTPAEDIPLALATAGRLRFEFESELCTALGGVPMTDQSIRVVSGNFVHARPAGVHGGQDLERTGEVRRVDKLGIVTCLDAGQIVLLSPIGYSPSGELFLLNGGDLATEVAVELRAAKLIALDRDLCVRDTEGLAARELTVKTARELLAAHRAHRDASMPFRWLQRAVQACKLGVRRGHLLDAAVDGALISELFTRDGIGTMVASDVYDETRRAQNSDIVGIVELITPLEERGALVRRPREKLEREIERFYVMERDGSIVACAAVYPLHEDDDESPPVAAELACLAVAPAYRNSDRGDALLRYAEREARALGATRLVVLTTQAAHWFQERGFVPSDFASLPAARRQTYNFQRNSKVLAKALD